nr:putative reverse transcriptase domain-containing protein [Tanacetum cinerariifolium]
RGVTCIIDKIMPPRRLRKKSVKKLVERRVAKAIEEYEKTRADSINADGSGSASTGGSADVQRCSYKIFMKCKPHSFNGTEGVVGLKHWVIVWCVPDTPSHGADPSTYFIIRGTLPIIWIAKDVGKVFKFERKFNILKSKLNREDKRGGSDNHRSSNNNYSGSNNRNSGYGRYQRNRGQQSNRSTNSGSQQSRGPSEGYSYPCGQAGHLQKDCKKNTTASTSGQADKKPGASGRVFAITEGHAANTSGTITGTLSIYGYAVFVLFDTGATHYVISFVFASRVTTTPILLDHVLCISTPMQDSVRITLVYRDLSLQFDDKIRAINAFPLDMYEFDIILGMDWLTEHHAMIDCRSYRVSFSDIHAPEFIYHGSLPGKSMQIISALQARTLLSHGCEGFLANIHDTTSDVPSIHDQPIVSEFSDVFPDELPGIPPVQRG